MAKDYKYTDSTPVDEPVSPPPKQAASAPKKMAKGGMAKGGSASSRADGCAKTGKTRGTMITMKSGGMC
jgi:hypothetical protein